MTTLRGAWCLVSREYPPHSGGGIGTYATMFSRLLAQHGIRVVVVTAHSAARTEETLEGVHVIRLPLNADDKWSGPHPSINSPATRSIWNSLGPHAVLSRQIADLVPELLDRFGVSVIEGCETGAPLWHLLADRADSKWTSDLRILTHVHSPSAWIEHLNRRLEQSITMHQLQRMEREQTRASDAVVTPSVGMRRWLQDNWNVHADVIRYPFAPTATPSTETGGTLFVGRLEYRKGIDTLLRAWPSVRTNQTLRIVGSDTIDYRTNTPIGASLLKGLDRVEHMGPLPPDRVAQLQTEASVVVVPSPDDNFPFTCIEAMAAGCVVVAASNGGAAEMIEHGNSGWLFEPYNSHALADALSRALAMPDAERARMSTAARSQITKLCEPKHILQQRVEHAVQNRHPTDRIGTSDVLEIPTQLRALHQPVRHRPPLARRVINKLLGR